MVAFLYHPIQINSIAYCFIKNVYLWRFLGIHPFFYLPCICRHLLTISQKYDHINRFAFITPVQSIPVQYFPLSVCGTTCFLQIHKLATINDSFLRMLDEPFSWEIDMVGNNGDSQVCFVISILPSELFACQNCSVIINEYIM